MSTVSRPTTDTTVDLAHTLASLASDTNQLAGRSSAAWDFTSNPCFDIKLNSKAAAGTSPTAGKTIEYWPIAKQLINAGNSWPDVLDGTDSNKTVTSRNVLFDIQPRGPIIAELIDSTSNRLYYAVHRSLYDYFGGTPPMQGLIWVVQNTGVAFNATGTNFVTTVTPIFVTAT